MIGHDTPIHFRTAQACSCVPAEMTAFSRDRVVSAKPIRHAARGPRLFQGPQECFNFTLPTEEKYEYQSNESGLGWIHLYTHIVAKCNF